MFKYFFRPKKTPSPFEQEIQSLQDQIKRARCPYERECLVHHLEMAIAEQAKKKPSQGNDLSKQDIG